MSFDIEIFQKLNEFRKNEKKSMDFLKYQAKEMFRILSEKELDAFVQFKALNQFKISLESIIKINNRHKSWWQWFISFFGFVSQDEKSIRHILRTTRKSLSPLKHLSPLNFLLQEPTLNEQLGYKFYNRKEKIKYLAHHLMGTQVFSETSQFHGMSASDAYKHFYHDLKDFIDQYYTNDESIIHDFNKVLSNLEYAYILAYQLDIFCAFRKHLRDDQKSGFQANFIFNIKMKILNLSPGESFITPYVYQEENGGHALIIEWVKDNDGQFFAKIINTGEGNDQTASFKTQFLSFFYDERPIKKTNNYPLEVLHTDFIDRMFDPIFSSENQPIK